MEILLYFILLVGFAADSKMRERTGGKHLDKSHLAKK